MKLDTSSLRNAIGQLEEALAFCNGELARSNAKIAHLFRTAAIQTFEFTYELSWKMLRRYLEVTSATPEAVDQMAFPDLIRTGSEQALLLSGWDVWKDFRKARGITSHVYDEAKANEVFAVIPRFRDEARFLLNRLEERNASA